MVSRLLSRLLFCIALLTQIGAPIAGGLAMAAERGAQTGSLTAFCRLLHDDELGGTQDPSKAPRGGEHHQNGCSLCPLGVGEAPLAPDTYSLHLRITIVAGQTPISVASAVVPPVLERGAAPRAPPFLV